MSLKSYIEKTKALPENEKKRVLFVWVFSLTFIIFLFWAINFTIVVSNQSAEDALIKEKAKLMVNSSTTPDTMNQKINWTDQLGSSINNNLDSIKEGFNVLFKK